MPFIVFYPCQRVPLFLCLLTSQEQSFDRRTSQHGCPQKIFHGGNADTLLILCKSLTMQCKSTFTKRFTLSTPQRRCPMLR